MSFVITFFIPCSKFKYVYHLHTREGIVISPKNPDWLAGFKACLDLIKHRLADAETVDDVVNIIQSIDVAVTEKQVEQLVQELAILY